METKSKANGARLFDWDRVVKVTCHNNCSYNQHCVINAFVKDGKVVGVEPTANYPLQHDPSVPDWNPRGCQKGLVSAQRQYGPSRLKTPLKRVGERGAGKWEQISWDQALTEISDNLLDVIAKDGVDTVFMASGSGGKMVSEAIGISALMASLGIGTLMTAAEIGDDHQGAGQVFGQTYSGASADNWYYADTILIWGGNPSYTAMNVYHFITEAKYHGSKVIAISPDYSPSAIHADVWVPVNIGTDAALALSMAHVILKEKLYKDAFIREQTDLPLLVRDDNHKFLRQADMKRGGEDDLYYFCDAKTGKIAEAPRNSLSLEKLVPALEGEYEARTLHGTVKVRPVFELLRRRLEDYNPEKATRVTGVAPRLIEQLAREVANSRGVVNVSTFNWGKFYHGDLIERSIVLLFCLCGHMGRKGATYTAFTGLANDSDILGVGIRGFTQLIGIASADPRYANWKLRGYTDEMVIHELGKDMIARGDMVSGAVMMHFHGPLLDMSKANNSWDSTLKRPLESYVKESLGKKWQTVVPAIDKDPKIIFQMGGSFIHQWRATERMLKGFLPKLRMLVSIEPRMSSSALYADYVLPAASWYEKYSFHGVEKPEFPYGFVSCKATEPQYDTKGEWEMACLLAKTIEERGKARGMLNFNDASGAKRRLDNLSSRLTGDGMYTKEDEEALARDAYANTGNLEQMPWEEFKEKGITGVIGTGSVMRGIGNACDIVPGETMVPFTFHIERKMPYPTQTRRMQFYIEHDWFLELGEELPAQKVDPKVGGDLPLRVTGGHTRWSVHSYHADDPILLRLQRGEPLMFMARQDAESRGIKDGDRVEVSNQVGAFQVMAAVTNVVRPGQVMIYHGWENFQFPGKRHFKNVMGSPLNPIEMVGGHYHIRPDATCFHPGFNDRDSRVEVKKVAE